MPQPEENRPLAARFGAFEMDLHQGELRRDGRPVALQDKPLKILLALLETPGSIVTREELRLRLWPEDAFGAFDDGLNTAMRKVRQALEDSAASPEFIETIPKRGYRFIANVEFPGPTVIETNSPILTRPLKRWRIAILASVTLLLITLATVWSVRHFTKAPAVISSIVVLPFDQLSANAGDEYFADGLTDALITDVAKIRSLRVISRASSMQFRGKHIPIRMMAGQLGVDAAVEGSVTRSGQRVRITAQLIDARGDRHLWADSYEGDFSDILNLQNRVAEAIARQIRSNLTPVELARFNITQRVDPKAYEEYLRGRYFWNKYTGDGWRSALVHFQAALAQDPAYSSAYSGLADCYLLLAAYQQVTAREAMPLAIGAARRALELDSQLAAAHYSLAFAKTEYEYDWSGADEEFRLGLTLDPSYAIGRMWHSLYLSILSRHEEAISEILRARELDPVSLIINTNVCRAYVFAHKPVEAIAACRMSLGLDPHFLLPYGWLARAYEEMGDFGAAVEARRDLLIASNESGTADEIARVYRRAGWPAVLEIDLREQLKNHKKDSLGATGVALAYLHIGRKDEAFVSLEEAYRNREAPFSLINVHPDADSARSDPRFQALLQRMKLSHY